MSTGRILRSSSEMASNILDEKVLSSIVESILPTIKKTIMDSIKNVVTEKVNELLTPILKEQENLPKDVVDSKKENESLINRINDMDQYSKLDNLLFYGLPLESYADAVGTNAQGGAGREEDNSSQSSLGLDSSELVERAIINFCKEKLDVAILPTDISIAHRLKGKHKTKPNIRRSGGSQETDNVLSSSSPPPIIVRFCNKKIRNVILSRKRRLRESGFFINEHLTPANSKLFFEARREVANHKLHSTWTRGGKIFAKETERGPAFIYPKTSSS